MSPLSVEAVEIPWPQREQRWPSWLAGRPHRRGLQVRGELRRIPGIIRHWYHRTKNQRTHLVFCGLAPQKKNLNRREGKGHRWGTKLIQFLAALAILHQDDLKNRMNCTSIWRIGWINPFLQIILVQNSSANSSDDICLLFCIYTSSMYELNSYIQKSGGNKSSILEFWKNTKLFLIFEQFCCKSFGKISQKIILKNLV